MHGAGAGDRNPDQDNVGFHEMFVTPRWCDVQQPSEASPDAVEDVSVGEDPDVQVRREDVVELADLLISKKGVRHPHFACISQSQIPNSL